MSLVLGSGNGGQVPWIWWLRHDYGFVFDHKLTHKHRCVSWCVIMVQNPWLVIPQFCAFLTNCLAQSAHNFKTVCLIDRTTLWQKFMMHHTIALEENSEQNLHIWPNLTWFFRFCFWMLPLGWLGCGFHVIAIWFITSYELFEKIWIVVERSQYLLISPICPCDVVFVQNLAILVQSSLTHVLCLKHSLKLLGMSRMICQHHQQPL